MKIVYSKANKEAVKAGIAIELNFDNCLKPKSYYKFNKELLEHHITNRIQLEVADVDDFKIYKGGGEMPF